MDEFFINKTQDFYNKVILMIVSFILLFKLNIPKSCSVPMIKFYLNFLKEN